MKLSFFLIAALLISPMAHAAGKEKKPDPVKVAKDKYRDDLKSFMEDIDKNRDGSLSRDEYLESQTDKEAAGKTFDTANKNGDRALTKTEIGEMIGIDKELKQVIDAEKAKAKEKKNAKK